MVVICLLLPSFLGIKLLDSLLRNENVKDTFINYGVIASITNIISLIIFTYFIKPSNLDGFSYNIENWTGFTIKYLIVSSIISLVVAFIYSLLLKNISISLEYNEKRNNK